MAVQQMIEAKTPHASLCLPWKYSNFALGFSSFWGGRGAEGWYAHGGNRREARNLKVFGPSGSSWVHSSKTSQDCADHYCRNYFRSAHQGTWELRVLPTLGTSILSGGDQREKRKQQQNHFVSCGWSVAQRQEAGGGQRGTTVCTNTSERNLSDSFLLGDMDCEVCCPRLPHNDFLNDSFLNE